MNREWNSKRKDSLLHSSVPALPGNTNPTGCYDMTWCTKRSVSYLSLDSWCNPVQVLHPNSHAERNPSISNTPPSTHIPVFPTTYMCVCMLELIGTPSTHSVSHAHSEICYKAIPGSLPHRKPFSLSFSIAKKTLSSHFPVIFISHLHISNSNKNTLTHQHLSPLQTSRSHCYHLNMPTAELGPTGTSYGIHCRYFPQPSRTDGVEGHVCYSFQAHTAMVSILVTAQPPLFWVKPVAFNAVSLWFNG